MTAHGIRQLTRYTGQIAQVDVFTLDGVGGNPCPVVLDALHLDDAAMLRIARQYGHESAFILPSSTANADFVFRFFVPAHEMTMCGHATIGALWLLRHLDIIHDGHWRIQTQSGVVNGEVNGDTVRITQPAVQVTLLDDEAGHAILTVLGITSDDLAVPAMYNASTSRTKTLLQLNAVETLHRLRPRFEDMQSLCDSLQSTGLYPFVRTAAPSDPYQFVCEARQFPRASGYPEDAATGIAATALVGALEYFGFDVSSNQRTTVFQGRAMGRASRIQVTRSTDGTVWLSGAVTPRQIPGC